MENQEIIEGYLMQEAYYGKLPEFDQMEKLFDVVIDKAKKEGQKCNPNKYPEMKKIEKLFCKLFGFKKSIIYWEPYNMANAYTYSINTFLIFANKKEKMIEKQKNGFYDTSNSIVLTVYLSVGLILTENMTSREMIGVILHEIGHNFDLSGYHLINYYLNCILTLGLYAAETHDYKNMKTMNDAKLHIKKKIEKESNEYYSKPKTRNKYNNYIKHRVKIALKTQSNWAVINLLINTINLPLYIIFAPIVQFSSLATKKSEVFADSFATAYGYGVDLISALEKLGDMKKYYNPKSGIQKTLVDLGRFQNEALNAVFEPHGTNQERCHECEKKLRKDLRKGDYPPELKEELEKEIERIHQTYKVIVNMPSEEHSKITRFWRRVNHIIFRGAPNLFAKLFKSNKV